MNSKIIRSAESALNHFSLFMLRLMVLVPFFFLYASFRTERVKRISVIEYNVWNGFESEAKRTYTFVKWARKQNADVIAFEELNNFTQASFSKLAKSWGHPYAVIVKENGYPVGITSRYPISNVYRLIDGMHHGCLYAEINGINFFVVHFSPFSSKKRLQEAASVMDVLRQKDKLEEKTIVLGDFNAFSPKDSLFYANSGIRDSMYVTQQKNKVLQNLNGRNQLDYQVIRAFLQSGFYDSFSLFHKYFEESYPSKVYPGPLSDKIRIDYMMISEKLKASCSSVEIIKDGVTDTLSDHYPVRAEFEFKK
ncbi:endonuclease/exonuclease/phosphatase family protein [Pedobacter nutrimenti]|uniref:endonuclease/exonuclease/phosphatase family protein n=1 Tax=Pedobacter nutrimenti TaxID=1241337 RepID=UPI00292D3897|nr:endonuclease/exonuclease/phosphatase family protein [Pedobacter nutrimenti]